MKLNRKIIDSVEYKGRRIVVRHLGPDLLCEVDGSEMSSFYLNTAAAREAGKRYVDQIEKEAKK